MGTQSDPCCSSATPSLTLNPKTYRLQRGSYVAPSSPSSFSSPLLKTAAQDGGVQDQAELPRGLLGSDQQADQHGILRLLCLSLHVFLLLARRPGPAWLCGSLCEGVWGGERAWDEADGLPEQERWSLCLPGYRQAGEHGVGQLPRGNGGRPRAGEDGEPEPAEITKAADAKADSHLSDFVDEFLEDQVASIKSIGDTITKLKRVGDGLGLFLFDKEMAV